MLSTFSYTEAKEALQKFLGKEIPKEVSLLLEDEWYASGEKDFDLYCGDDYLLYLLKAHEYSRKCVSTLVTFWREVGFSPKSLIDCGTGLGFFAAYLAKEFPECGVVATNLPSKQFEFNKWLFSSLDYPNLKVMDAREAGGSFEVLLLIEGFEHYQKPEEELDRLVEAHSPDYIVESSSFSRRGLGHFSTYEMRGGKFDESQYQAGLRSGAGPAFRMFTQVISSKGFERIPIVMRNWSHSRPRVWKNSRREKVAEEVSLLEELFFAQDVD